MTPDRLLALFDRISDAPDAIPRLRRFILDLAVRGKLVEQDPDDEPIEMWLTQSKVASADASPQRRARKSNSSLARPDAPFPLPQGWQWLAFGRIHHLVRGVTYSKSDVSENLTPDHLPILRANNIGNSLNFENLVYVRRNRVRDDQKPRRGDYLIALSSGSKNLVGKTVFVSDDYDGGFGGFCGVIRLISHSLEPFVGVFLASPLYRKAISAGSRGIGINNLQMNTLRNIPCPLPPLAEQHRIVARVDELMALCDQLEAAQAVREAQRDRLAAASLQRLNEPSEDADEFREHVGFHLRSLPRLVTRPEHIPALRQTILNLAVRGKLVPQDPNDEPAIELLARIQTTKVDLAKTGKIKKDKVVWDGLPQEPAHGLPSSWVWTRLQDVFEISRGGSPRPAGDPRYFGGPIPWITVREITRDSEAFLTQTDGGLTEEGATRSRFVNPGDLLLTNSGATLGVPKISRIRGCINDGVAVLRLFHESPLNDFAYLYLYSQTSIFRAVNQGMGQPNLNTPIIAGWFFPLPSLAEQSRIVNKVNELLAICDELGGALARARDESRRLLEAVLHEALAPALSEPELTFA